MRTSQMVRGSMPLRGDRLRDLRLRGGYTHEEFAELIGVGTRQTNRYESGETDPSGDVLSRIARALGVTTDYLLGLTDDPTGHITETELSPMERRLIAAVRDGSIVEVLETVTAITKSKDQPIIPPNQPAVHS